MIELSLYSFLSVVWFQMIGAWAHFKKMKQNKRVRGTYFDYLVSDSPNKSAATGILMLGSAWFSITAGNGDLLNPILLWEFLTKGILHVPSINAVLTAIMTGYTFDSVMNKGDAK